MAGLAACVAFGSPDCAADSATRAPDILLVTVDTLRPDHLSGYGYERETSPYLDRLMESGVRYAQARTVVPLTCPALSSMFTTLYPHVHGSTRNGIRIRPGLPSLPKTLAEHGYATVAFVSNWALQDRLCGLAEHFESWNEILVRRRFLVSKREADARDVTAQAREWIERQSSDPDRRPFFAWVHYMDPHFPYLMKDRFLDQIGVGKLKTLLSARNRYDSEIAYTDHSIGQLLDIVADPVARGQTVVIFSADHGESLGQHGYWGHGRHVYESGLRIPLSITWPGHIAPGSFDAPALITDIPATLLGLIGLEAPASFEGFDWSPVIRGEAPEPTDRATLHEAHRGTVKPTEDPTELRRAGLLEIGRVVRMQKEVLVVDEGTVRRFDLSEDRSELESLAPPDAQPSADLAGWLDQVRVCLASSDDHPPTEIDAEDLERLKALGYVD